MSTPLDDALHETLADRMDRVPVPRGDLAAARRRGRALRRRRRVGQAAGGIALAGVLAFGAQGLVDGGPRDRATDPAAPMDTVGELDFSQGLRAYADPGREIHLGGRSFPADDLAQLDTAAAATPYGVVFFRGQEPWLLQESGESIPLPGAVDEDRRAEGPSALRGEYRQRPDFQPVVKVDSTAPHIVFSTGWTDRIEFTVYDLAERRVVERNWIGCFGSMELCGTISLDAFDDGVVLHSSGTGVTAWTVRGPREDVASSATSIVDLRAGVVLYAGEAPTDPAVLERWRWVPAAVDAQLTHDGRYVLDWSSRLRPIRPDDRPVVLERGPVDGRGFWTVDTDGSVLVAEPGETYPRYWMYDCEVPSGRCVRLGELEATGGDPVFIGSDM